MLFLSYVIFPYTKLRDCQWYCEHSKGSEDKLSTILQVKRERYIIFVSLCLVKSFLNWGPLPRGTYLTLWTHLQAYSVSGAFHLEHLFSFSTMSGLLHCGTDVMEWATWSDAQGILLNSSSFPQGIINEGISGHGHDKDHVSLSICKGQIVLYVHECAHSPDLHWGCPSLPTQFHQSKLGSLYC